MRQPNLWEPEEVVAPILPDMRRWQARTVPEIRNAIKEGHKRIQVQAATGGGKTLLAAHMLVGSLAKGKKPVFAVPDLSLIDQTIRSFENVGIRDIGVIQGYHERTDRHAQVQIASIQTLVRRELPEADLIFVDESHVRYEGLQRIMADQWKDKVIVGLSATPWARGMGLQWQRLIVGLTIAEGITDGILCPFRMFVSTEKVDRKAIGKSYSESGFDDSQAAIAMSEKRIVADVVQTWMDRWGQDRTFMFCVNRAHAKEQQAKFEDAGIPFGYIDGTMSIEERRPVFDSFREGSIKGIASVGCLIRGVDEDVRYIVDCQPTKSEMQLVQKLGRGLRNRDGKTLLIADHAGNHALGLFNEIHHEILDSRDPKSKERPFQGEKKPKKAHECPKCHSIFSGSKCSCGYVLQRASGVQSLDGDLVEYGSGQKSKVRPTDLPRQDWYSGFLHMARQRGRADGWAAHRYKERFGVWPNGLKKETMPPAPEVIKFDTHIRIKFRNSFPRGNHAGASEQKHD